jgi:hypothetical protein
MAKKKSLPANGLAPAVLKVPLTEVLEEFDERADKRHDDLIW